MKKSGLLIAVSLLLTAGAMQAQTWQQKMSVTRTADGGQSTLRIEVPNTPQGRQLVPGTEAPVRGFRILADDGQVMAFSEEHDIDIDNLPPALVEWMQWAGTTEQPRRAQADVVTTGPLLQTLWDQDEPYNDSVPSLSGYQCATGCVATSTSQVLYFHRYPTQGIGSISYEWNGQTLSCDFSRSYYNWSAMLASYDDASSDRSKSAVAKLMRDVGYSMYMSYGYESGASPIYATLALREHFGYEAYYLVRSLYSYDEWEQLMRDEILAGRPVIYDGSSSGGGHSFVLDGYRTDGYFHVNWGWGGTSNGWFRITRLTPSATGIGAGSGDGYNYGQGAMVGITPARNGGPHSQLSTIASDSMQISASGSICDAVFYGLQNVGVDDYQGYLVMQLLQTDGTFVQELTRESFSLQMFSYYPEYNMSFTKPSVQAGNYIVRLYAETSDPQFVPAPVPVRGPLSTYTERAVTVSAQGAWSFAGAQHPSVQFRSITPQQTLYNGHLSAINYVVQNGPMEYYDSINVYLKKVGSNSAYELCGELADIRGGASHGNTLLGTVYAPAGNYVLVGASGSGDNKTYWWGDTVTVAAKPAAAELSAGTPSFPDNDHVQQSDRISVSMQLSSGTVWSGTIHWYVFYTTGGTSLCKAGAEGLRIDAGQTVQHTADLSFGLPAGDYMTVAFAQPYGSSSTTQLSRVYFHLDEAPVWTPDTTERVLDHTRLEFTCEMPDTCYRNGYLPISWSVTCSNGSYADYLELLLSPKAGGSTTSIFSRAINLQENSSYADQGQLIASCEAGEHYLLGAWYRNDSLLYTIIDSLVVLPASDCRLEVAAPTFPDGGNVPTTDATVTIPVRVQTSAADDAVWSGSVELWVMKKNPTFTTDKIVQWGESQYLTVPKSSEYTVLTFNGDLPLAPGEYEVSLFQRATTTTSLIWARNGWTFTVGGGSAVENVELPQQGTYYDVLGREMGEDYESLPRGVYIINGKKVMK